MRDPIKVTVRPIGLDHTPGCFVCGGRKALYTNFSAFVDSKEDGERAVELFRRWFRSPGARLDWREYEPTWIQVKIGACDRHARNLGQLRGLMILGKTLTSEMVSLARAGDA